MASLSNNPELEEMEKSLWKQCDDVCKRTKEVKPLCKQFQKYVKLLRDDRASCQKECFGLKRQRVSVIKYLEGLENAHVQVTLKLQGTLEELEKTASKSELNIEIYTKEQQILKKDVDNVNQQIQSAAGVSNEKVQRLKSKKESLQLKLEDKKKKIRELKEKLEQTNKELEETRKQMEKEKAAANSIQVAATTMIERFDPTDRQGEQFYNDEIMNKIRFNFVRLVIPRNVLHIFHKYDTGILTQGDIEVVDSVTNIFGPSKAAGVLLGLLSRYKNWYPCLQKVLRDPQVKMKHAADQMEADLKGAVTQPEEPDQKLEAGLSSCLSREAMTQPEEPEQKVEAALTSCRSRGSFDIVCAVQEADLKIMMSVCENKKKHGQFIRIEDFNEDHLSQMDDDGHIGDMLVKALDLVVRIEILETNPTSSPTLRPKTPTHDDKIRRIGSGMVWDVYKRHSDYSVPCSCRDCQRSRDPKIKWAEFGVLTSMGLMQYDPQCKQTVCHLSYKVSSGEEVSSVLTAVKLKDYQQDNDKGYCELSCITHDQKLAEDLDHKVGKWRFLRTKAKGRAAARDKERCAVVSYPHGLDNKYISLGPLLRTDKDKSGNPTRDIYKAATCDGCSGAPVFFYMNGVFTGQTVHNGKNALGESQSIEYRRGNWRFD